MVSLNPLENAVRPATLSVPNAFRAWSHWANTLGIGCLQVPSLQRTFEGRTSAPEQKELVTALCEVYARAVFETAIGLEYDRIDSHADVHVFHQIADRWGSAFAATVHARVAANGPVARELVDTLSLARPTDPTVQQ